MRALLAAVCVAVALAAFADDPPKPPVDVPAPPVKSTDALVDAARAAKAKRKSSTRKVITNADVKKAKGRVVEKPAAAGAIPVAASKPDTVGPLARQDADYKSRREGEARVAAAQLKLEEMEQVLLRLESAYFDENDPAYRDDVIRKRFEEARRQRDMARQQLDEARAALAALTPAAASSPVGGP